MLLHPGWCLLNWFQIHSCLYISCTIILLMLIVRCWGRRNVKWTKRCETASKKKRRSERWNNSKMYSKYVFSLEWCVFDSYVTSLKISEICKLEYECVATKSEKMKWKFIIAKKRINFHMEIESIWTRNVHVCTMTTISASFHTQVHFSFRKTYVT